MNELKIFDNEEFGEIRTVLVDGEPWFVGNDCAKALGYKNPYNGVIKNTDEEDRRCTPVGSASGVQQTTIINESGLYSLIFSSKLESAKRFKHWVTSEVLPSIRKTGSYIIESLPPEKIPIGEVASYAKVLDRIAVRQQLAPHRIAANFKMVSEQFGIHLTDDFVKVPEYEQMKLQV
ncbi:MAG: Bro-N domain-containing protein [Lachnospiraceae bacterium]|nr:Bro-N domain-containing protein [Lachnospiraceae bacterium]